jgi:hypothetical protein
MLVNQVHSIDVSSAQRTSGRMLRNFNGWASALLLFGLQMFSPALSFYCKKEIIKGLMKIKLCFDFQQDDRLFTLAKASLIPTASASLK